MGAIVVIGDRSSGFANTYSDFNPLRALWDATASQIDLLRESIEPNTDTFFRCSGEALSKHGVDLALDGASIGANLVTAKFQFAGYLGSGALAATGIVYRAYRQNGTTIVTALVGKISADGQAILPNNAALRRLGALGVGASVIQNVSSAISTYGKCAAN